MRKHKNISMVDESTLTIAVVGLGYVGLPLCIEFGKHFDVVAFDISRKRVEQLSEGFDYSGEISIEEIKSSTRLKFSDDLSDIKDCNVYIIAVPTPVDDSNNPDLTLLCDATELIGTVLSKGNTIIFESTVYPGATEEICVPILEKKSQFQLNYDFFVGYSPERINPGDKNHGISDIKKVTSGSSELCAQFVDGLYSKIISAGTYLAPSIKVAEAAKIIENTQRDLNVALMNELAILFHELKIDSHEVFLAAETKWNFLPFRPGLVGGHCIGVDPYYLTYKARTIGFDPVLISAGRSVNDRIPEFVARKIVTLMTNNRINLPNSSILLMGLTFKENCADLRNSGVKKVFDYLRKVANNIDIYDPVACGTEVELEYGIVPKDKLRNESYDAVVVLVPHDEFKSLGVNNIKSLLREKNSVLFDLKSIFPRIDVDGWL